MLRHALVKSATNLPKAEAAVARAASSSRWYAAATSRQKRALDKSQLEGTKKSPETSKPEAPPLAGGVGGGSSVAAGGGGDNTMPIVLGVGALAAAGGAYYYFSSNSQEEEAKPKATTDEKKETAKTEKKPSKPVQRQPTSVKAEDGSNRVIQIELPTGEKRGDPSDLPTISHPEGGNKVTGLPQSSRVAPVATKVSVQDSLKELQASIEKETSEVMKRANEEATKSFDASLFEGLDNLDRDQLKARVLQLASEMHERTRWEALRLKEFLTLKERETADKYVYFIG